MKLKRSRPAAAKARRPAPLEDRKNPSQASAEAAIPLVPPVVSVSTSGGLGDLGRASVGRVVGEGGRPAVRSSDEAPRQTLRRSIHGLDRKASLSCDRYMSRKHRPLSPHLIAMTDDDHTECRRGIPAARANLQLARRAKKST